MGHCEVSYGYGAEQRALNEAGPIARRGEQLFHSTRIERSAARRQLRGKSGARNQRPALRGGDQSGNALAPGLATRRPITVGINLTRCALQSVKDEGVTVVVEGCNVRLERHHVFHIVPAGSKHGVPATSGSE